MSSVTVTDTVSLILTVEILVLAQQCKYGTKTWFPENYYRLDKISEKYFQTSKQAAGKFLLNLMLTHVGSANRPQVGTPYLDCRNAV